MASSKGKPKNSTGVFWRERKNDLSNIFFNINSRKTVTKYFDSDSGNDNFTSLSFLGGNVTLSSQRMSSSSRSWLPQIDAVS